MPLIIDAEFLSKNENNLQEALENSKFEDSITIKLSDNFISSELIAEKNLLKEDNLYKILNFIKKAKTKEIILTYYCDLGRTYRTKDILCNAEHFFEDICKNINIKAINIYNINLTESVLKTSVAQLLKFSNNLKFFKLTNVGIDDDCLITIFNSLKYNTTLKSLDLSNFSKYQPSVFPKNEITYKSLQLLPEILKHNKSLEVLDLSSIKFDYLSVKALADSINNSTSIKALDLSNCEFNDDCLKIIIEALRKNNSIKYLFLCQKISESLKLDYLNFLYEKNYIYYVNNEDYTLGLDAEVYKSKFQFNNSKIEFLKTIIDMFKVDELEKKIYAIIYHQTNIMEYLDLIPALDSNGCYNGKIVTKILLKEICKNFKDIKFDFGSKKTTSFKENLKTYRDYFEAQKIEKLIGNEKFTLANALGSERIIYNRKVPALPNNIIAKILDYCSESHAKSFREYAKTKEPTKMEISN